MNALCYLLKFSSRGELGNAGNVVKPSSFNSSKTRGFKRVYTEMMEKSQLAEERREKLIRDRINEQEDYYIEYVKKKEQNRNRVMSPKQISQQLFT